MNIFTLAIIVFVQIFLILISITSMVNFHEVFRILGVPIYLFIVVILNIASLYILGKIFRKEERRNIKNSENTHVEQFNSLVASVRSDRHDLNNHLTVISGLIQIKKYEAANDYIEQMIGDIHINNKVLTVKNPILASMLFPKMTQYHKNGIHLELNIENEADINILSSTDLIRLISNLLDNAFDATLEISNSKERFISLYIDETEEKLIIIVQNTTIQTNLSNKFFEAGYSTKSDSGNRGFGLAIIEEIIKKYNGTHDITTKDQLLTFKICFPKVKK
ncbi:sensor histidine kinase [Aquibacillus koreensis]|nr:GHKL domain-containing protein [Aquibacillus koreensis]